MAWVVCQVRLIYLHYNIMMRWLQQQQNTDSKFESQGSKTSRYCILTHPSSLHIYQIACMLFSTQAKGATKQSPQNSVSCTGTTLSITLSSIKHNECVAKLHSQFILHLLFCRHSPLVHMYGHEKFIFPVHKHAFGDWKNSPDMLSILHAWNPVMMNAHSNQTWNESDGVSGQ